ncbi:hypothetical protein K461DRAFT_270834 [Myriangium duriaei CBS 260.36]|uniref:4Fe-4S ferredoxin-type domain-containing protein n=1 Tax=Myriangium duriaei CBS 260.36 TaxID=1168546 RepID=A0A9P4IYR6_9PEZI|nr:hypothetical protein K461DRAFT_270834 [Myriangium duriaei CBS 260.36]
MRSFWIAGSALLSPILAQTILPTTTTTPAYCGTTWTSVYSPTYTFPDSSPTITPPLPCPGAYSPQDGFCCSGSCIACPGAAICGPSVGNSSTNATLNARSPLDLDSSALLPRGDASKCTCPDGVPLFSFPLDPCVSANPFYSGCPGNMAGGVCCSGPGIGYNFSVASTTETDPNFAGAETSYTPICMYNTALYSVTTFGDGEKSTSTYPPGVGYSNTICFTCPLYTRSTSSSKGGAARTAAPAVITQGPLLGRLVNGVALGVAVAGVL